MSYLLNFALQYAGIGWRVFPLAPGQKIPITKHGVKDATTDETQIRAWWAQWPNANIAVACGAASGVYVVDVDISAGGEINGLESLKEFPPLPITVRQDTPRGGYHAFFKTCNAPANRNSFRPGVDIRGDGYYVVLAPSIHPNGGCYAWGVGCSPFDRSLVEFPDFMRPVTRAPWAAPVPPAAPRAYSDDTLRRASLYLATCDPAIQGLGGHDKLLWAAVAMVHGFQLSDSQVHELLVREYNPRCIPPWDLGVPQEERDFSRKIAEARKLRPQNPPGWLLNDDAYAPCDLPVMSSEAVQQLIAKSVVRPPAAAGLSNIKRSEHDYLVTPTGLLGEICSWVNSTALKPQPYLTLACALAFLGTLFGRKVRDALGSRTNLYCMGIAPSSAGKAHAMGRIRQLAIESGCITLLGGDNIASDSAIEDRVSREPATLFMWDEIGHILVHIKSGVSSHHAQVVALLMKLYSAAGNIYLGREYAEVENQRRIIQPCCCIYGTGTPERFTEGVSIGELHDGWLSRCLVFYTQDNPLKNRDVRNTPVPESLAQRVNEWFIRKIGKGTDGHSVSQFVVGGREQPPEQIVVEADREAEARFIAFDNESITYGEEHPQLACLWMKAEENARRIALIVAASESFDAPRINLSAADYACRLCRNILIDFGRYIAPEIVSGEMESKKRKLINVIGVRGVAGCTRRDLIRGTQWVDVRQRSNLLQDLIDSGEIVQQIKQSGKGVSYWTAENYRPVVETDE
jgi:hypothetical protein